MYEKPFKLDIIAPDRVVFSGEVTSFSAPGVEGGFQVLVNHAPLLSSLDIGEMKVKSTDGVDTRYAASGGFVEVRANKVIVLVETAERSDVIDIKRASAARERAQQRLQSHAKDIDFERAKTALYRALNRLRVASKA
jgi:F-type H+-transporting ATPase subunit epsilon